jgi:hypothetical protein
VIDYYNSHFQEGGTLWESMRKEKLARVFNPEVSESLFPVADDLGELAGSRDGDGRAVEGIGLPLLSRKLVERMKDEHQDFLDEIHLLHSLVITCSKASTRALT